MWFRYSVTTLIGPLRTYIGVVMNILRNLIPPNSSYIAGKIIPKFNFSDNSFISYMYCMACQQLNLGGHEYEESLLRQVFTEEEFKKIGSIYIDVVKDKEPRKYERFTRKDNSYDFGEIVHSFCSGLKNKPELYFGLLYYACNQKLENIFTHENPLSKIQNSPFMTNFANTFCLNDFEISFLLLNLFGHKNIWFLPEPLSDENKIKICSRFLSDTKILSEAYINQINKKFIKLGFFSDDWEVNDYVYSYFSGNSYPFKICSLHSQEYSDYYSMDSIATENFEHIQMTDKLVLKCKKIKKGCYIAVSNADTFRSKNFITYCNQCNNLSTLEITNENSNFEKNDFIFFLIAASSQLQNDNGVLLLGNNILSSFLHENSENRNTIKIFTSSSKKENDSQSEIPYDLFQYIHAPVYLLTDSLDSDEKKLLNNQLKIVYNWEIKNPSQKEYEEQLKQFLSYKNIDDNLIESTAKECRHFQISPEKWNDVATLISILKDSSDEEIKQLIEANFQSSDNRKNIRKNSHYSLDALKTTEPVENIVKALHNAEKWQTDEYNSESGIRILNYGPSGTGKTAFVENTAKLLDKPLKIVRASDILGMYVGETEKNIKQTFEDAAETNSILLIDEADSFLHSRGDNINRHNDSKVNEFLVQMERFPGILFCNTNLPDNLDSATDRRFHMKIGFEPLDKDGISLLCKSYFDKFEFSEQQINEIFNSGDVTPGDFGSLYGRMRFTDPDDITTDFICDELVKVVKGKKRSWENKKSIGFCG